MTREEVIEILKLHEKWLNDEEGGKKADFKDCNLSNLRISEADFTGIDFTGANLSKSDFRCSNFNFAIFTDANFSNSVVRCCTFKHAELIRTNFYGSDMEHTNLEEADCTDADFRKTQLGMSNIIEAWFCNTDFNEAVLNCSCMPLSYGNLRAHYDDNHVLQQLYHILKNVQYSKNVSNEIKEVLLTESIIELANRISEIFKYEEIKSNIKTKEG